LLRKQATMKKEHGGDTKKRGPAEIREKAPANDMRKEKGNAKKRPRRETLPMLPEGRTVLAPGGGKKSDRGRGGGGQGHISNLAQGEKRIWEKKGKKTGKGKKKVRWQAVESEGSKRELGEKGGTTAWYGSGKKGQKREPCLVRGTSTKEKSFIPKEKGGKKKKTTLGEKPSSERDAAPSGKKKVGPKKKKKEAMSTEKGKEKRAAERQGHRKAQSLIRKKKPASAEEKRGAAKKERGFLPKNTPGKASLGGEQKRLRRCAM